MSEVSGPLIASLAVGVVAVDNVIAGHDPFPQLVVGGLFVGGVALVSEVHDGLGTAVAATFLVATVVLHSTSIATAVTQLASVTSTQTTSKGRKTKRTYNV